MNKNIFALTLLAALPLFLSAQTSTVRGAVFDQQSEMPLIGATVQLLPEGSGGAITDVNGAFVLNGVPVGRQAIRVSYLGYETQTAPNILVTAGKDVQVEIRLREALSKLQEVVINGNTDRDKPMNEMATVSARQFNTEEVLRYSGGRNDVAKLVASFAGVAANNDARNDIIIRGNSPTGVLWRMEGIPIPNPNHFASLGTTGGPVSALNPNLIANSDFLTGAFPAEYGNALAGVFDVNLRTGNKERYEFMGQLAAFSGMEAMAEGPLNKKHNGSFLVAYRHSFVELADLVGLQFGTAAVPRYKDLSFNLDFGNTKAGRFSLFGIAGYSKIEFLGSEIDTTDLWGISDQNAYNTSKFGVAGLKHNLLLNDHAYWRTVASVSYTGITYESEDLDPEVTGPSGAPFKLVDVADDLAVYRLSSFVNNKINHHLTLRTGVLLQYQNLNTFVATRDNKPDTDGDGIPDWVTQRDFDGGFGQAEAYVQGLYRLNTRLTLNAGLHGLYFDHTGDFAVEPRAALNWQVRPKHSINLGYGEHNQAQPLPVYFYREYRPDGTTVPTNENLGFTRSRHLVLGYAFKPASSWRVKAETYYQWIDKAPVDPYPSSFSLLNAGADFVFPERGSLVNEGSGKNLGAEFTVEKFFDKGWYSLVTLSVFDSKYKGSDGKERSTAFDGGYVFNALGGKEFRIGKSGSQFITIDTKLTYAGGRPYTPVNLDASRLAGVEVLYEDQAFSLRQSDYFRWDAKIGYRLNSSKKKLSTTFYLDFQNITNRENLFAMRYNAERGVVGRTNQIGFFPDVLYRVEF